MVVVCIECGKTFTRRYNLDRHMKSWHSIGDDSDVVNNDKVTDSVVSRLLKGLVNEYGDKDYVFNYID